MIVRMFPILFNPDENIYPFYTMIEFATPFARTEEVPFLAKTLIIEFIWLGLLIYCLKMQSSTHPKHSMKNELILVICVNIFLSIVDLIIIGNQVGEPSLFFKICSWFEAYPPA
jgi:hypothetical protein